MCNLSPTKAGGRLWVEHGEEARNPRKARVFADRWLHNNLPMSTANKKDVVMVPDGKGHAAAHQRRVWRATKCKLDRS
jgi:hypothetical protein